MSEDVRELSVMELYFTGRGRLSGKDYGKFYLLPSVLIALTFAGIVILGGKVYEGDKIYASVPFLSSMAIVIPMTAIAYAKRSRDINAPAWLGLLPFLFIAVFACMPIAFPGTQDMVNGFFNSSSSAGLWIGVAFWYVPSVNEGNLYGPPCKVVLFKKRSVRV
ncbi:MAG TPA: hypothetical protein DEA55_02145 [Rhodospirillaceae bacterium]|nr:hypothetical protein [Rhodospirillaceae bacterium]